MNLIAPNDTVLGLLQCGRGDGYRRILNEPRDVAHKLLFHCITHDPRVDQQCESRCEYYADIAVGIGLPLDSIAQHLKQNDDQTQFESKTTLSVTFLEELARRDYQNSRDILCDYIGWGQWWEWHIDGLLEGADDLIIAKVADALERRFPSDDPLDDSIVCRPIHVEGLEKLSLYSTLIKASAERTQERLEKLQKPRDFTSLTPQQLLDLAENQSVTFDLGKQMAKLVGPSDLDFLIANITLERPLVAAVALRGLEAIVTPALYPWLLQFWNTIPEKRSKENPQCLRNGARGALLALPPELILPLARGWISDGCWQNRHLAEEILIRHATLEDIPTMRSKLREMLTGKGDDEWSCHLINAFDHLPGIGVIPELVEIYEKFRFSLGRVYAVEALQITAPDYFAKELALECLWDCEPGTQEVAVKARDLSSNEALVRVRQLGADPFVAKDSREAAQKRIANVRSD